MLTAMEPYFRLAAIGRAADVLKLGPRRSAIAAQRRSTADRHEVDEPRIIEMIEGIEKDVARPFSPSVYEVPLVS